AHVVRRRGPARASRARRVEGGGRKFAGAARRRRRRLGAPSANLRVLGSDRGLPSESSCGMAAVTPGHNRRGAHGPSGSISGSLRQARRSIRCGPCKHPPRLSEVGASDPPGQAQRRPRALR
ncbi:unnamed protein product, partial [Symbiodinium sp. CCMP2456]